MKRFWTERAVAGRRGFGRSGSTAGRSAPRRARCLRFPTRALAEAIAANGRREGENVDPRAMPLTGLANAAIDRVGPTGCLRREPRPLRRERPRSATAPMARRSSRGRPRLGCAARLGAAPLRRRFRLTSGVISLAQPPATIARLAMAVAALDPFPLAGLSPLVTIGGSLVAALAVIEGAVRRQAWAAVGLDERWQARAMGRRSEPRALALAPRDFLAAARFLELLG